MERTDELLILDEEDYAVLDERSFGAPGLEAAESLGPFVKLQASGPIITIHDAKVEPHLGIGHHPHRFNERLFYMLRGALSHDDALNQITGHMGPGDLGRLTEGRRGMYHKEWNDTDEQARAFILVYETDPVPPTASFAALRDGDAPRYEEGAGVTTKELIGDRSPLEIHGDIRRYFDSTLEADARVEVEVGPDESALIVPLEGSFLVGDAKLEPPRQMIVPEGPRTVTAVASGPGRLLRVIHGKGRGLVFGQPWER